MNFLSITLLCSMLCIYESNSYYFPPGSTGRAAEAYRKWKQIFGTKKPPGPTDPIVRIPRHHKWRLNEIDEDDDHESTTTTTAYPITKSPQQIHQELEEEKRRKNPKNVFMGGIKEIVGTTPPRPVEVKVKEMEKTLKSLQTSCTTNDDCTNKTCCLIGQDGTGKCSIKPHIIGHECSSDMCPCADNLECKLTEIDQDKPGVMTSIHKCVKKTVSEDSKEFIEQFKNAIRNVKGCSSCRNKKKTLKI